MKSKIISSPGEPLTGPERDELKNMLLNEPVFAGDTISHATAKSLSDKGFISRNKDGKWIVNQAAFKNRKAR